MLKNSTACFILMVLVSGWGGVCLAGSGSGVQDRIDRDIKDHKPLVIHVVVALCDNEYQSIVPVPEKLGNGQDPDHNLYWGALYGVRTYLTKKAGWKKLAKLKSPRKEILERIVLFKTIMRKGVSVPVYIVADAWNGKEIKSAVYNFLDMTAGGKREAIEVDHKGQRVSLSAGGDAHFIAYIGHNGLMDFSLPETAPQSVQKTKSSSMVLACESKSYFLTRLKEGGSHPLILTTGLMAPEAYTLDAVIHAWLSDKTTQEVRTAAARAYHKYQKTGLRAAKNLFWAKK